MNDTLTLDQLQIKRRELENEFTKLLQREQELKSNLKTREKAVIKELESIITNKKEILQILESQNTSLSKKLNKLKKEPEKQENHNKQSPTDNNDEQPKDKVQVAIVQENPNKIEQPKPRIIRKKETKFFY
jgi:poly(3-hydroxyalkanoate) synthetase